MWSASYYYLEYPDCSPTDPTDACTEMYVELHAPDDPPRSNQGTYAFKVYTFRYAQREFIEQGRPLIGRSVILVPTLADDWMLPFLQANVDRIAELGEDRG